MSPTAALALFTSKAVIQQRAMISLLVTAVLLPCLILIPVSLFMLDLGKVFTDFCMGSAHIVFSAFVFFIAGNLISSDIDQRVSHLFLTLPLSRERYLIARFSGLLCALFLLAMSLAIATILAGLLSHNLWPHYVPVEQGWRTASGIMLLVLPYIGLTGLLFLIACWSSSAVECMVFFTLAWIIAWFIPAVLAAITIDEVTIHTPAFIGSLSKILNYVLPDMDSAKLTSLIAHKQTIGNTQILAYVVEHLAYTGICLLAAIAIFKRRDLS